MVTIIIAAIAFNFGILVGIGCFVYHYSCGELHFVDDEDGTYPYAKGFRPIGIIRSMSFAVFKIVK